MKKEYHYDQERDKNKSITELVDDWIANCPPEQICREWEEWGCARYSCVPDFLEENNQILIEEIIDKLLHFQYISIDDKISDINKLNRLQEYV